MSVPHLAKVLAEEHDTAVSHSMTRLETMLDGGVGSLHQQDDVTVLALRLAEIAAPMRIAA